MKSLLSYLLLTDDQRADDRGCYSNNPIQTSNTFFTPSSAPLMKYAFLFPILASPLLAETWPLDDAADTLIVRGNTEVATGAAGQSLVLDGESLIELKDSAKLASGAFTISLWFNPYELAGGQQMLAGKNRYSRDERQWSLTIEPDGRLQAYLHQGGWRTISCAEPLKAGAWHWVTLAVGTDKAALFLNGKAVGEVMLKQPIAATEAAITLGGIWDAERVRQAFHGALDAFAYQPEVMNAEEIATSYRPVLTTHEVPQHAPGLPLWDAKRTLLKAAELPQVAGAEFYVIKNQRPDTDQCKFTLGVGLAWHKEKLYASYGYNKGHENTPTEEAHVKVSEDGGKTWRPTVVMDAGEGDLGVSHGVFLSHGGRLWAFMGAFYAHEKLYHRVHARAYLLNESTGAWESRGAIVEGGFWPMQEPLKMADGNWIMAGFRIGGQFGEAGNLPAVAISQGDDFMKWDMVVIPAAAGLGQIWGESTVIVEDKRILNISRYGKKALALLSVSEDNGRTWTPSAPSNLPMATSKPYAGTLSTGQRYLVCTTTADTGGKRSPLTIAVSKPGESLFSKVFLIRPSVFEGTPGVSAPNADFSYPYAVEHEGKLYIGYTHKSHGANELAVLPVSSLQEPEPVEIWSGDALPKAADLPLIDGARFSVIKPYEFEKDGYRFLHGVGLGFHKGKLYASFGHNQGGENTDTEEARFCVSEDQGRSWSAVQTMDDGGPEFAVSHGVFLSRQGALWAFMGSYRGTMQRVHTRAYRLNETTGEFEKLGVVIEGGFWPMQEPVRMDDGNWIMAGISAGGDAPAGGKHPAAVAISHGDDLLKWDLVLIPQVAGLGKVWGESTVIVEGKRITNLSRYGAEARALIATSEDYGRSWTAMRPSDLPMATSKPYAGTLSTGQRYLICSTSADGGARRSPLTIAVSKPGESKFSKVFVVRHAEFLEGPGESHERASLSYPYAIEHEGHLYIGYSNSGDKSTRVGEGRELWNNNSAELAVILIEKLKAE